MTTNLTLDDRLIETALELGGHQTESEAVTAALEEYIRRRRPRVLDSFGSIDFDESYDYKAQRRIE